MTNLHRSLSIAALAFLGAHVSTPCSAQSAVSHESGLVGLWLFEEGAGQAVIDSSGNENHGSVKLAQGKSPEWGEGDFAGTLALDGKDDSHVEIPSSDSLNTVSEAITVIATIYPRSLWLEGEDNPGFVALVQRQWQKVRHPDQYYLGYGMEAGIQTYKWHAGVVDGEVDIYARPVNPPPNLERRWTQIAATYDSATGFANLFVNGEPIGSDDNSGSIRLDDISKTRPLIIGAEINWSNVAGEFDGYVDEVRLYNRALTASEIRELAESSLRRLGKE